MNKQIPKSADPSKQPYSGYYKHADREATIDPLTYAGPQTPMGEYMRRFWQPVCLSEELTEVPKAVRILNEDLVAFRDRSGRIGVLDRHCSHRGTSLEYGIIQEQGIRCCYHGWQYDVDGTILETPCEPPNSRIKDHVFHGAYPAFEREGLVFAYMGPPDAKPDFEEFDAYSSPQGGRLVPFSNIYACNWLQVFENLIDHFHAATLHNNMTVASVDSAISEGVSLGQGFRTMPIIEWQETRDGNGMMFSAGRRIADDKVWVRITEMNFPNFVQTASVVPTAAELRHTTVGLTRWHVPVDDHNMIIFGWRHFNDEIDPNHAGNEDECGIDKVDFLIGQTDHRTYLEGQLAPGDYEAITSIGTIAPHKLEHLGASDIGITMCRALLRSAVRGKTQTDTTRASSLAKGDTLPVYSADSVLNLPKATDGDDNEVLLDACRKVVSIMQECDALPSQERKAHARRRLDDIDGGT